MTLWVASNPVSHIEDGDKSAAPASVSQSLLNAADDTITLEQVQRALAKINGSLVDDFARERDERF